jgi:hypothetical protein
VILVDALRVARIENMNAPTGTPVRFKGKKIGCVISGSGKGYCEIAINSDKAYSLIRSGKQHSFSIEVVKSD